MQLISVDRQFHTLSRLLIWHFKRRGASQHVGFYNMKVGICLNNTRVYLVNLFQYVIQSK